MRAFSHFLSFLLSFIDDHSLGDTSFSAPTATPLADASPAPIAQARKTKKAAPPPLKKAASFSVTEGLYSDESSSKPAPPSCPVPSPKLVAKPKNKRPLDSAGIGKAPLESGDDPATPPPAKSGAKAAKKGAARVPSATPVTTAASRAVGGEVTLATIYALLLEMLSLLTSLNGKVNTSGDALRILKQYLEIPAWVR